MIDTKTIEKLSTKWQTTRLNVLREYCQQLFLSNFYEVKEAEGVLFKGGTALRIIYGSPRFSEDLDFSSTLHPRKIESLIVKTLYNIEKANIDVSVEDAKITSGGYLVSLIFTLLSYKIKVLLEISLRKSKLTANFALVNSEIFIPYTAAVLEEKELVREKIQALLTRKKPRDYFDLYFIIRSNLLTLSGKKLIKENYKKIISTKIDFKKELKIFLPHSYHNLIKSFPQILKEEIKRQIG